MAVLAQNKSLVMKHWTGTGASAGKSASALATCNDDAVFLPGLLEKCLNLWHFFSRPVICIVSLNS
jgi:hypothetical protein